MNQTLSGYDLLTKNPIFDFNGLRHANKTLLVSAGCIAQLRRWPPSTMLNIACFGRLALGRFARPWTDATVLLECLRRYNHGPGSKCSVAALCRSEG